MRPWTRQARRLPALTSVLVAAAFIAAPCRAGTLTGGAGFDYQTGPGAQSYRSALLFGYGEGATWDATLAIIRYGDSRVGPGVGMFGNASAPVGPRVRARAVLLRAVGDDSYRAWRWRLGPELRLPSDRVLGAYYLRLTNNVDEDFGAVGVELQSPIATTVTGQLGSSYGEWSGGATSAQASLSGFWRPWTHALFLAEFDLGRNLVTTSTAGPSSGGALGGLPILGGGRGRGHAETTTSSDITGAAQIGIRFLLR
jgi:hypothetical protein